MNFLDYQFQKQSMNTNQVSDLHLLFKSLRSHAATGARQIEAADWSKWLREKPCCRCGGKTSELHHIFGSFMSLKTSDIFTVPICRDCHNWQESHPVEGTKLIETWILYAHAYIGKVNATR